MKQYEFHVTYQRVLDELGQVEGNLPEFAQNASEVESLYRLMVLTRLFDKKAIALQRTGKLGTYPSTLGQEAIGVGIGFAMRPDDVLCPYYREYGAQFCRQVAMEEIWLYWGGDERGSQFAKNKIDFPLCVPIASQTLHAVGVATAMQYKNEKRAVVTTCGDGGTSRGDFYESINVAGVWNLPVVFVINNNQFAISLPREEQTKAKTLAQKGIAAGIEGIQIDGNDVFAVREVVAKALQKAYRGEGPTIIEALSYRMGDHTTADDASRYRTTDSLKSHEKQDPIIRLRNYMVEHMGWNETREKALYAALNEEVQSALTRFEAIEAQNVASMFDYLYETLPKSLESQKQHALSESAT